VFALIGRIARSLIHWSR